MIKPHVIYSSRTDNKVTVNKVEKFDNNKQKPNDNFASGDGA